MATKKDNEKKTNPVETLTPDKAKAIIAFLTRDGGVQLRAGEIAAFSACLTDLQKIAEQDNPEE